PKYRCKPRGDLMRFVTLALIAIVLASGAWARDSNKVFDTGQKSRDSRVSAPNPLKVSTNSNRVSLTWSNITGETGFVVERRRTGTNQFAVIGNTATDVTKYTDTLTTSGIYQYRVRAYSSSGGTTYSRYTNTAYVNTPISTTG